jgi:hypothetical protein
MVEKCHFAGHKGRIKRGREGTEKGRKGEGRGLPLNILAKFTPRPYGSILIV